MQKFHIPVVIIGGGISGCWLFRRLRDEGIGAILIEKTALGTGQTIASQGMVHGGQRYTLQGKETEAFKNISLMPQIWDDCLNGTGKIDLTSASKLSENQYMWSPGGIGSKMTAFFASKSMQAHVESVKKDAYPEALQEPSFKGNVYRMDECVLNIDSVLSALVDPYKEHVYQGEISAYNAEGEGLKSVVIDDVEISADRFIFTAGQGNEELAEALNIQPEITQRRPLRQVMVKGDLPKIYGHCIAVDNQPRMTITTHVSKDGENVWYIGGKPSEKGASSSEDEALAYAKSELTEIFPWINWDEKDWATLYVNRAEPRHEKGLRHTSPVVSEYGNTLIAWPTKLTFAPGLAEMIVEKVNVAGEVTDLPLPQAPIANYPWDEVQWRKF